ncbi:MAG TPA: hypothetical protein VKU87_06460 [Thermomicrobiaceae bacterium]|nr:hypothetical protein [Thermomicrobiaceae bacterium]
MFVRIDYICEVEDLAGRPNGDTMVAFEWSDTEDPFVPFQRDVQVFTPDADIAVWLAVHARQLARRMAADDLNPVLRDAIGEVRDADALIAAIAPEGIDLDAVAAEFLHAEAHRLGHAHSHG